MNRVLPAPDASPFQRPVGPGGDGVPVAGAHQAQEALLGRKRLQGTIPQRSAQVFGKRRSLAHGEHPGLRARMVHHGGDVTGGEHTGVRRGLEEIVDLNEPPFVHSQARLRHPTGGARPGHPQDSRPGAVGRRYRNGRYPPRPGLPGGRCEPECPVPPSSGGI